MSNVFMRDFRVYATMRPMRAAIDLFMVRNTPTGMDFIDSIIMRHVSPEDAQTLMACAPDAPLSISPEVAQELMDVLWQVGIRPSEGTGSAGALAATQSHLKDLQDFSFRLLSMIEKQEYE